MLYSPELLHYFYDIRHSGSYSASTLNHFHAEVGAKGEPYWLRLSARYEKNGSITRLVEAKFQAFGSTPLIAACEYVCRWLEGKTSEEARALSFDQLMLALALHSHYNHVALIIIRLLNKLLDQTS